MTDEAELRRAVLRGEVAAWELLYDRAFAPLERFVRHRSGSTPELADDVIQEAWMVAVRRVRSFDPDRGTFALWVCGIAARVLQARSRRERARAGEAEAEPVAEAPPAGDLAEYVRLVLATLPPHYRAVLRAKYQQQMTVNEIAGAAGGSGKAIESLLGRARSAFREAFERLKDVT